MTGAQHAEELGQLADRRVQVDAAAGERAAEARRGCSRTPWRVGSS